jgi:hypothetical protein
VPGPGAYDAHDPNKETAHAVSMSFYRPLEADPSVKAGAAVPGPGAYDPLVPGTLGRDAPAAVFGTGMRTTPENPNAAAVPGPGAYNPELYTADGVRAVTIAPLPSGGGPARPDGIFSTKDITPGPGAYEVGGGAQFVASDAAAPPSYSFGVARRFMGDGGAATDGDAARGFGPGPGAYYTPVDPTAVAPAAVTIPKAARFGAGGEDQAAREGAAMPGPGQYDALPLAAGPHALILGAAARDADKANDALSRNQPGPGQYDARPEAVLPRAPVYGFGTPLDAEAEAARFRQRQAAAGPGPGQYDAVEAARSMLPHVQGPVIAGRGDDAEGRASDLAYLAAVPGPGQYDVRVDARGNTGAGIFTSIPQAGRDAGAFDTGGAGGPGPSYYDVERANRYVFDKAPSALILGHHGTGPHAGDGDGAGVSSPPGPGQYDLGSTLDKRAAFFTTVPRDGPGDRESARVPGPGFYAIDSIHPGMGDGGAGRGPAYSIARAEAWPEHAPQGMASGLGAGYYDGARAKDLVLPAPYYVTIPRATDRGDAAGGGTSAYVGPGAYNLGPAPYAGPAWSMPHSSQPAPHAAGDAFNPYTGMGPGYYNVGSTLGGPAYTFAGGRGDDTAKAAYVPGPGSYQLTDYDPYRRTAVGVDMAKSSGYRPPAQVLHSGLGPGQYNVGYRWDEAANRAPIHWRFVEPYVEPTPGPPDYWPTRDVPAFHRPTSEAL